jgi:hypothetical protein
VLQGLDIQALEAFGWAVALFLSTLVVMFSIRAAWKRGLGGFFSFLPSALSPSPLSRFVGDLRMMSGGSALGISSCSSGRSACSKRLPPELEIGYHIQHFDNEQGSGPRGRRQSHELGFAWHR